MERLESHNYYKPGRYNVVGCLRIAKDPSPTKNRISTELDIEKKTKTKIGL